MLQKAGANLDLPNYASVTAVMAAQARGFHEIASMLLKCMDSKAYLEMKEKERGTPLKKVLFVISNYFLTKKTIHIHVCRRIR